MTASRSRDAGVWPPSAAPIVLLAAIVGSLVGALVSALVLTAAGSDRQNGAGTLVVVSVAGAIVLVVIRWLARRGNETTTVQLALRPPSGLERWGLLVIVLAAVALTVSLWSLIVDVASAIPVPAQVAGTVTGVLGGAQTGPVKLDPGVLAGVLGAGVITPWVAEVVLRGVALPALAAWRGPALAVALTSVAGLASGVGAVVESDLLFCVLVLQIGLCGLRLGTGSLLPPIILSGLVTGLAIGVALNWSAPVAILTAVLCALGATGLNMLAIAGLDALD